MKMPGVVSLDELVDGQKIGSLVIRIVVLSLLVQCADGFDLAAMSYAAPELIRAWHFPPADLGPVFSAGLVGMALGGPLLGYVGDRYGRRVAIIVSTVVYGLFSLATVFAPNLTVMLLLRFVLGVGLGGLLPNTVALNAEFAPRRLRATLIIIMFMGLAVGGILPSVVATTLSRFGWQAFFVVGGVAPLLLAVALYFLLPESIKFLVAKKGGGPEATRLAAALRPDLAITPETRLVMTAPRDGANTFSPALLFADGLAWITVLVWLLFSAALVVNFFVNSWMPTLFRAEGLTANQTAVTQAAYYVGGIVGGLAISRMIDRWGIVAIAGYFLLGCPVVASIGTPGLSHVALTFAVFLTGACVLGSQLGMNAVTGMIYPTTIRSKGAGWASAVGRIASTLGPVAGGALIARHTPLPKLFLAPLVPLAIGAMGAFALLYFCYRRFRGLRLHETAATAPEFSR
ncbi:MFS transporter [Pinirhizobacter soli]|uniref:MFS transporter n=1 Tax=Pinirhizobacter soli TaxID=2786953 RepID=UPI002029BBDE|nr:MFS transporter [Pinirhizobacter soli]